mmetsp:Transcript_21277/g.54921  ORF Transcript_21277/g.54921 Transcript_21277/m.54921 type:complete len:209 (-) Transcript_21277:337-963(-)
MSDPALCSRMECGHRLDSCRLTGWWSPSLASTLAKNEGPSLQAWSWSQVCWTSPHPRPRRPPPKAEAAATNEPILDRQLQHRTVCPRRLHESARSTSRPPRFLGPFPTAKPSANQPPCCFLSRWHTCLGSLAAPSASGRAWHLRRQRPSLAHPGQGSPSLETAAPRFRPFCGCRCPGRHYNQLQPSTPDLYQTLLWALPLLMLPMPSP